METWDHMGPWHNEKMGGETKKLSIVIARSEEETDLTTRFPDVKNEDDEVIIMAAEPWGRISRRVPECQWDADTQ